MPQRAGGRLQQFVRGRVRAPRPEGPLLKPGAAAVTGEPDDPQVAVLPAGRMTIADLGPDHGRRALHGKDVSDQGEDLVWAYRSYLDMTPVYA